MLKYLSDELWQRLPTNDFRARFYVESYSEKLRMQTPHFHQARLMNIFSACEEMLIYIDQQYINEKNSAYVISAMKELDDCWSSDIVAQETLSDLAGLRILISKKVQSTTLNPVTLERLRVFCRATLSRYPAYELRLLGALEEAVIGEADIAQTDRITAQIYQLTGLYVTNLLNRGYSPTYLFNRADMFTREGNYAGRNFTDQFRQINERLRTNNILFSVHYGLSINKAALFTSIEDDPIFTFSSVIPPEIQDANLEKFKKDININLLAHATIEATDHVSAALRTKDNLDRLLDQTTAFENNVKLKVSAHCAISYQINGYTYTYVINVDLLLAFMSTEVAAPLLQRPIPIHKTLIGLNSTALDQIGRSFRHQRLARQASSLEQKLLNLWIALEALFQDMGGGILNSMLEYIPQIYATIGLSRRIEYIRSLLVVNTIGIPEAVRAAISTEAHRFNSNISDEQIFLLLKNEPMAIVLFDSIEGKEHLKFKLKATFKEFKDNNSIKNRILKSEDDVARQLRRIYFFRNKIAHTGHFKGVRPQLITHLSDYLYVTCRAISHASTLANNGENYSIIELLTAARMGADVVMERASSRDAITSYDQMVPSPII